MYILEMVETCKQVGESQNAVNIIKLRFKCALFFSDAREYYVC